MGLGLRDVKDCTLCCRGRPGFDVSYDNGSTWTNISFQDVETDQNGGKIILKLRHSHSHSHNHNHSHSQHSHGAAGPQLVRYGWSDFVECVVSNNDSLPASPFQLRIPVPATSPSSAERHTVERQHHHHQRSPSHESPPTPPMGFNTWNAFHCNVDENEVLSVARAARELGLADLGYEYINIDDCWQSSRDAVSGRIIEDSARFPSKIDWLAGEVHKLGMKFGLYTSKTAITCQDRPASYRFEHIDAQTYCDWDIDYIKIDRCGGAGWPSQNASWIRFKQTLDKCKHKVLTSVEYCREPDTCGQWIAGLADLWRTTNDVQATWASIMSNIHGNDKMAKVAKLGHYNDPDMLQIGNPGLSISEQRSQFSLWAIASAPLLISTEISSLEGEALSILKNKEVIAVDQDPGVDAQSVQGTLVKSTTTHEVWVKRLANGDVAAVLLNIDDNSAFDIVLDWKDDLGLQQNARAHVRDLWQHKDLGEFTGQFTAKAVPPHGVAMFVVSPKDLYWSLYDVVCLFLSFFHDGRCILGSMW